MLDGTDPKLLFEWQAYYDLEPFGEERADIRNGITCLTIAQAQGMKKHGGGKFELKDFMPELDKPKQKTSYTPDQAKNRLMKLYGNNRKP